MRSGWSRWVGPALVAALIAVGLFLYRDFGITWDEPGIHHYGDRVLASLLDGDRSYESDPGFRNHGPFMAIVFAYINRVVKPTVESQFVLGHLVNYLVFVIGAAAFYALCKKQFGHAVWGVIGAAILLTSPRVFSHAFVNQKDAPLMSFFIVSVFFLIVYLEKASGWALAASAIFAAIVIDIRITGIMLPLMAVTAIAAEAIFSKQRSNRALAAMKPVAGYCAVLVAIVLLFWPYLWTSPIDRFVESFQAMSHFDIGPTLALYLGEIVALKSLPWHYLPVWIAVTTPIAYLVFIVIGAGKSLSQGPIALFRERSPERHFYLYAAWGFGPLLLIAASNIIVYDEWRHALLVYPALCLFAVQGIKTVAGAGQRIFKNRAVSLGATAALVAVAVASSVFQMWRLHPYEGVYFNALTGGVGGAEHRFELDYWGLSYKEGIRILLSQAEGPVDVASCTAPGEFNALLYKERARLRFVKTLEQADFAICAPRSLTVPYLPEKPTVYAVTRDGADLLLIKSLRPIGTP